MAGSVVYEAARAISCRGLYISLSLIVVCKVFGLLSLIFLVHFVFYSYTTFSRFSSVYTFVCHPISCLYGYLLVKTMLSMLLSASVLMILAQVSAAKVQYGKYNTLQIYCLFRSSG